MGCLNPYRAAEMLAIALLTLLALCVVGFFAWFLTVTESWRGFGIAVLVIGVLFVVAALHDEWENIGNWWRSKRDAWDSAHSTQAGKGDG